MRPFLTSGIHGKFRVRRCPDGGGRGCGGLRTQRGAPGARPRAPARTERKTRPPPPRPPPGPPRVPAPPPHRHPPPPPTGASRGDMGRRQQPAALSPTALTCKNIAKTIWRRPWACILIKLCPLGGFCLGHLPAHLGCRARKAETNARSGAQVRMWSSRGTRKGRVQCPKTTESWRSNDQHDSRPQDRHDPGLGRGR